MPSTKTNLSLLPGIIVVASFLTIVMVGNASAQDPSGPSQAQVTGAIAFNIPAQPLASGLTTFGRQAGLQVVFESVAVSGKSTAGVVGTMTADQAIQQLLAGTGATYRFSSPSSITVTSANASGALQLDPVKVQAFAVPQQAMIDNLPPPYAGGQVATGGQLGLLGNRGVMDTPFNQTSYTAKKAQDQQAKTIRDVLADDPSVRSDSADGIPGNDAVYIRGFSVSTSAGASYGGLYGMLPTYSIMAELAERIEVLKGPSAFLNGMPPDGAIGGTINIVPKRAPDEDLTQVTANYVSAGQVGGHVDVGRRFGADKEFGVRFNGVFKAGQSDIQYYADQRALAVLGLDYRGNGVRLSADLGYQYQNINGLITYMGPALGVALPWAPSARNNASAQPWSYSERKDLFGVFRGEVDLTERVTAYAAFGAHDNRLAGLYPSVVSISNFNGAANVLSPQSRGQYSTYLTGQAGLRAFVDTGPIGHEVSFSATTLSQENGLGFVLSPAFATNIYNPVISARPNLANPTVNKTSTAGQSSLALADTLSVADKRVQLTAGARLQQVTAANYNATSGVQTSNYNQSALSPSVALIVKPFWESVSFYANWIQGLQQGTIVGPTFTNAGEVFPPYKSTQYEAGVKVDWGKLTTTASIFQISQPSILTNTVSNTQYLGGAQVNQGLELNFFGEISEGIRVLGGAMFIDARLTQTQGGATNGWVAPFVPGAQFNLAGEWDLPFVRGLTLSGRTVFTGSQYIDTTFPRRTLPEWTRFDFGARYAFENPAATGKMLVARFNVDNVLDANYWAGGFGATTLFLGAPRTFRLSLTADF